MKRDKLAASLLLVIATILTSTTSLPMLYNQPQEAAAQIIPEIDVQQIDNCQGVTTVCSSASSITITLQGDIEGDASVKVFQANTCQDGADCSNAKTDTLTVTAADTSSIDSFSSQEQYQH
jgi:hypothetical protein